MIGMYGSSPKVKCREGMCDASQLIAELKLEAYNSYWSLVRLQVATTKLNLDMVRSVKINCTCIGDSFEGTCFVCWPSRDRVSISFGVHKPRSCVDFAK